MNENSKVDSLSKESVTCVICKSSNVETNQVEDNFEYGSALLKATITVHSCADCSFEFTGKGADKVRHDAVCRHLGFFTPEEVRKIRKDTSMSKVEFADVSGIGEASLGRWERGRLLQSHAMDNLLYLLSLPGNLEALKRRHSQIESSSTFPHIGIITEELRKEQESFII